MNKPKISVIMPAFNTEKYIDKAIESILGQSFREWELIVVNDCSTDSTWRIVCEFQDPRIVKLERNKNSGSAYLPREDGINIANGEWIVNLDADDYIGEKYLEIMYTEAIKNNAEICTSQMIFIDENDFKTGNRIPNDSYDFNIVKNNSETFNLTVPYWKIGMNGALVKRSVWLKALNDYKKNEIREVHDDENLSRLLLLRAKNIITIREKYYFRTNLSSVSRRFSLKTFGWMKSNKELQQIAEKFFGKETVEYHNVEIYDFLCYKSVLNKFMQNSAIEIFGEGLKLLKQWYENIEWDNVIPRCDNPKYKLYRNFKLSLALTAVKQPRLIYLKFTKKYMLEKVFNRLKGNRYYAWYVTRKQREKRLRSQLEAYYNFSTVDNISNNDAFVACIYDGAIQAGGLADRLKGIIGVYYVAKRKGIPFKLYFAEPFPLEDFLSPNTYNWIVKKEDLCLNSNQIDVIVLDNTQDSPYQIKKQKEYLSKYIVADGRQKHIYTNASFSYELNYSTLFKELFKPSERLQKAIDRQCSLIKGEYISISCRFLDLLGDFNETYGYGKPLPEHEKIDLLNKIDNVLLKLHYEYPGMKILVNSDSITFLEKYKNVDYTYVIPGNITHIDAEQEEYSYEKYEKTFLDFMMIAGAEKIYLIKSGKMYKSGYPFAASKIYKKPFEIIEI